MAGPWTITLLCGLLGATLVRATLIAPAVLNLSPEVIKEKLTQELIEHDAITILKELPLLSAIREEPAGMLNSLVSSVLKYIVWMKVTSANILQLQVEPSAYDQELVIRIPLDMVAGFNMMLAKTVVEFHMVTEAQALVRVEKSENGHTRLVLAECSSSQNSLSISLLNKLSFMINPFADKVMNLLMPALPKVVKRQLCPVIQAAFDDMYTDLLKLVKAEQMRHHRLLVARWRNAKQAEPIALSPGGLEFDLLSLDIEDDSIELNLKATLLDSNSRVIQWFNSSVASQSGPIWDGAPFSLTVRQDLVNAVMAVRLPQEELMVMLDFVLPDLARELKLKIEDINKTAADKLGATEILKIFTQSSPELLLSLDNATAAQQIVLEVFPSNRATRPFFSLGIEANSEVQFYMEEERLMVNFNDISSDQIHLMISDIGLFNPELLDGILTKILTSTLLPNQNGKLRIGFPVPIAKALGYKKAMWHVTKDCLRLTPASS